MQARKHVAPAPAREGKAGLEAAGRFTFPYFSPAPSPLHAAQGKKMDESGAGAGAGPDALPPSPFRSVQATAAAAGSIPPAGQTALRVRLSDYGMFPLLPTGAGANKSSESLRSPTGGSEQERERDGLAVEVEKQRPGQRGGVVVCAAGGQEGAPGGAPGAEAGTTWRETDSDTHTGSFGSSSTTPRLFLPFTRFFNRQTSLTPTPTATPTPTPILTSVPALPPVTVRELPRRPDGIIVSPKAVRSCEANADTPGGVKGIADTAGDVKGINYYGTFRVDGAGPGGGGSGGSGRSGGSGSAGSNGNGDGASLDDLYAEVR